MSNSSEPGPGFELEDQALKLWLSIDFTKTEFEQVSQHNLYLKSLREFNLKYALQEKITRENNIRILKEYILGRMKVNRNFYHKLQDLRLSCYYIY